MELQNANSAKATFTAPASAADLQFSLTVKGPAGSSMQKAVVRVVAEPATAKAVAAPTSSPVGEIVTLDGSASTGAATYLWTQTGGDAVMLTGAAGAKAGFTMPATTKPMTFQLTVTGQDGSTASATVEVTPVVDNLTITGAEYRTGKGLYRISGTASAPLPDEVSIYLDSTDSTPLVKDLQVVPGNPQVWDFRPTTAAPAPSAGTHQVIVVSSRSGKISGALIVHK